MVGGHPDGRRVQHPRVGQTVPDTLDLGVQPEQRLDRQRMSDAVPMRGGVGVAQPHDGHRRVDRRQRHLQERIDNPAIPGMVGRPCLGHGPEPGQRLLVVHGGQPVLVVQHGAAGDRMVQEIRRSGGARTHHEHPPPGRGERLAERRRREQRLARRFDAEQVLTVARAEKTAGIDPREKHRIPQQPVHLGVGAGRDRRRVHPGHCRVDRVMPGHDHPLLPERVQRGHQGGGHVVGPQPVKHEQQVSSRAARPGRLVTRRRTAAPGQGQAGQEEPHQRGAM